MNRRDFLRSVPALLMVPQILANESLDEKLGLAFEEIKSYHPLAQEELAIVVLGEYQKLYLLTPDKRINKEYLISTSNIGYGFVPKSGRTPTGVHRIKEKIGNGVPIGGIFDRRGYTGRIATICHERKRTWNFYILTRIMTLEGIEKKNKTTNIRPIYLHGTDEEGLIGKPASGGCIRMKNNDVVELFNLVKKGTYINIKGK